MPIIQTAKDLGLAIRSRRKELGWDQATLANQVGVTRQWVIEIEKGKPRAELALAMRALRVLGLSLSVEAATESAPDSEGVRGQGMKTPHVDVSAIVERNRSEATYSPSELARYYQPKAAVDYLREELASQSVPKTAAEYLREELTRQDLPKTAAEYFREELARQDLPKTAAEYLREELTRQDLPKTAAEYLREELTRQDLPKTAVEYFREELTRPKLPKTAADYLRELESTRQRDRLTALASKPIIPSGPKRNRDDVSQAKKTPAKGTATSKAPRTRKP